MAKGFINDSTLTAIADAIRAKLETSDEMLPGDMAGLIESISTGIDGYEASYGTFAIPSVTTSAQVVDTGLSGTPHVFFVWNDAFDDGGVYAYVCFAYMISDNSGKCCFENDGWQTVGSVTASGSVVTCNAGYRPNSTTTRNSWAARNYYWIALASKG